MAAQFCPPAVVSVAVAVAVAVVAVAAALHVPLSSHCEPRRNTSWRLDKFSERSEDQKIRREFFC